MSRRKIAIFASGSGTNAEKIMEHFKNHDSGVVSMILSNKHDAGVIERALRYGVATRIFDRETFYNTSEIPDLLDSMGIDLVVLAGFLWLIPVVFIRRYPDRIVNIHPALLPKYGGKGMYGMHVHKAVLDNGEKESGISVHYVNEIYDNGRIILQKKCEVKPDDSPESLAERIHYLEHKHYPLLIEKLLRELD